MADRIVLNTISYHGHGAIENIVPELTARGYKKAFVCSDPDLIKFGVTKKVTDLLDAANFAYSVSFLLPNCGWRQRCATDLIASSACAWPLAAVGRTPAQAPASLW